jgi:thiosulfate/3-mercaptopyruvate sulfurtransferase
MSPIINATELIHLIAQKSVKLIDARVGPNIKNLYEQQHLVGAVHVDLDHDLANIKLDAADGGRHPLPDIHQFAAFLGSLGIEPTTYIVVYDAFNGANAAARFWWMLRAIGHERVQVLDGGFKAAITEGVATNAGFEHFEQKPPYPIHDWQLPIADIKEVERIAKNADFVVIDVRDAARYRGEHEPIDLIAGHIPGAINVPLTENLDKNGFFLPKETLKQHYETIIGNRDSDAVVVHCGSGVTACHTLLALDYAGLEIPKLYIGSWSEWSRNGKEIGKA